MNPASTLAQDCASKRRMGKQADMQGIETGLWSKQLMQCFINRRLKFLWHRLRSWDLLSIVRVIEPRRHWHCVIRIEADRIELILSIPQNIPRFLWGYEISQLKSVAKLRCYGVNAEWHYFDVTYHSDSIASTTRHCIRNKSQYSPAPSTHFNLYQWQRSTICKWVILPLCWS
jgi:hypothetical protein